jgi:predicted HicB family RNase H-like nuclease
LSNGIPGFLERRENKVVLFADAMKDTTISLKIERALKAKLVALARAENRSLSNFIEGVLKKEIANKEVKHSRGRAE